MSATKPKKGAGTTPAALLPDEERARLVAQVRALDDTIAEANAEARAAIKSLNAIPQNRRNRNVVVYLQVADTMGRVAGTAARARAEIIGAHPGLLAATADPAAGTSPADDLAALERAVEDDGAA